MQVNKRVIKKLAKNIETARKIINEDFDNFINKINEAETVEQVMKAKKELLVHILADMPLFSAHCYFCIQKYLHDGPNYVCVGCKYAVKHNPCNKEGSSWKKIVKEGQKFIKVISEEYYKGEKY